MTDTNRLVKLFKNGKSYRKIFMPFLVAGDPNIDEFKRLAFAIEPYVDILEIGIPFSDPIADGPIIQKANVRAFKAGINTKVALEAIKEIRSKMQKPIVILTYYNILIQGADTIQRSLDITFKNLKDNGVDGLVIADLPIEEAKLALEYCDKYDLILVFLVAPSTTEARLEKILKVAKGFVYLISVMGITGTRDMVAQITKDTLNRIITKNYGKIPILVGFGISKPEHATIIIKEGADGVIIGSAIVKIIENEINNFSKMENEMVEFVSNIRKALKS